MQSSAEETDATHTQPRFAAHRWRGYFMIVAATFCWGAAATAGKAVFSGRLFSGGPAISPLILTQARTTFSVLALLLFLLFRYGRRFFHISRRDLGLCALVGTLGMAGSNFFYYYAIEKASVAIAITLQYTAPVWVMLTMVFWGRERATLRRTAAVLLAILGCAFTIDFFHAGLDVHNLGVAAALVASFSFAFYNIAGQTLVTRNHPFKVMAYVLSSAAVLWAVLDPPWRLLGLGYTSAQWTFLFLFACLSMLLPYFFFFSGLKYLDPTGAVIASCMEPVFAILFAAAFLGEGLLPVQVLGIAAVLVAGVMVQMQKRRTTFPE